MACRDGANPHHVCCAVNHDMIEQLEQQMTRELIAEAQRLSREWIETHPQDGATHPLTQCR